MAVKNKLVPHDHIVLDPKKDLAAWAGSAVILRAYAADLDREARPAAASLLRRIADQISEPLPPEPLGLGAVVELLDGAKLIRT